MRERNIARDAALCCVKSDRIRRSFSNGVRYLRLTCVAEFISPSISGEAMYCTSICTSNCTIVHLTTHKEENLRFAMHGLESQSD